VLDRGDRPALVASISLLSFSAIHAAALIAFFRDADQPISWKSILALGITATGIVASALLWRAPTRANAIIAAILMIASLARLGPFTEWNTMSYVVIGVTALFLLPVGYAIVRLRD